MSKAAEMTAANFDQEVLRSAVPVLVDFWAEWCGPCKALAPTIDDIAEDLGDKIKVYKVDIDKEGALAGKFGIMSIPTLLIFKNGGVAEQIVGKQPKQAILDKIKVHLG